LVVLCLPSVADVIIMGTVVPLRAVPTPRGLIVRSQDLWSDDFAALVAQIDRVPPADAFFFYPYSPMLPYLTGRRHVAALDVMVPEYTTAEQFRETCVRVVRDARWLVVERLLTDPSVLRNVFPAMRDPNPPERRDFEVALRRAFDTVVHASHFFELRQRAERISAALCDRIGASPDARSAGVRRASLGHG
jgi:hypothetical protein